jgi:WD40 repeat protein
VEGSGIVSRRQSSTNVYALTAVGYESAASVWALPAGDEIVALPKAGNSAVFSPDGRHILIGGEGGSPAAVLRETDTGRDVVWFRGHTEEVLSVAFSPDGRRVLTGSRDGSARLWDAASGDELLTLEGPASGVSFVAFSFDGSKVVLGCTNGAFTAFESSVAEG